MNGPRLCCNACGKVTDSIRPFCDDCARELGIENPTAQEIKSQMFRLDFKGRKPEFGKDYRLGQGDEPS